MCSCHGGGHDPARRPRLVLRVGRAAGRPAPARPPGDRRRRGGARRELRGEGVRRRARAMGGRQARRLCPRRDRRAAAHSRPTPRRARRSSRSSTTRRRWSRALSIDEAFLDVARLRRIVGLAARDRRAPARAGARARSGCRSRSASRGRSSSPRSPAASAKPDGLLDGAARRASSSSCTRCRSSGSGASAGSPPAKLHARGITHGRRGRRARRGRRSSRCSAGRRAATSTRSRTTATRAACATGRRRRSIGSQRALGWRPAARRRGSSTRRWSALVDRLARRLRGGAPRLPHGDAAAALRGLHRARPARTRSTRRPPHTQTILVTARGLLADAMPLIERQGITLLGLTLGNLENDDAVQLALPLDRPAARSTRPSTTSATGSARRRSPARCCSAATRASRRRCSRTRAVRRRALDSPRPARCRAPPAGGRHGRRRPRGGLARPRRSAPAARAG